MYNLAEFKTWRANQGLDFCGWENMFSGANWTQQFIEHYERIRGDKAVCQQHLQSLRAWMALVDERERERESKMKGIIC